MEAGIEESQRNDEMSLIENILIDNEDVSLPDLRDYLAAREMVHVNVMDPEFGAVGDGVADDTQAIKDARDYLAGLTTAAGAGILFFPPGRKFLITDMIEITTMGTHVRGGGKRATVIIFNPSTTKSCFRFTSGESVHYQSSISGLMFTSAETTFRKTAIEGLDVSEFKVSSVNVLQWTGTESRAVSLSGREVVEIDDYDFSCDLPISINANPNDEFVGCDHFTLGKGYLYPNAVNYGVTIASGVPVTRFHIRGQVGCIGGRGLLSWNDTAYTGQHNGVRIENVAIEQQQVGTNYAIDMRMNTGIRNLSFENILLGQDTNGIRLTKPQNVTMMNVQYDDPAKEFLNITGVSGTVVTFISCRAQVGSTVTMANLEQRWANVDAASGSPIRTTSVWAYVTASAADRIEVGNVGTRERTGTLGPGAELMLYGLTPNEGLHVARLNIYSVGATKYVDAEVSINTVAGAQVTRTTLGAADFSIDASAVVAGDLTLVYDVASAPDVCKIINGTGESQQYIVTYKFC